MEIKRFSGMQDLKDAFYVREVVFVNEQGVPKKDEFDEYDTIALHVAAYIDGRVVGAARFRTLDDGIAKFERICVLEQYRKYGVGKKLIEELTNIAGEMEIKIVKLHAQTRARGFYEKLGFKVASEDVFMEDGIPHILMLKTLGV